MVFTAQRRDRPKNWRGDALAALALAITLVTAWTLRDWHNLSALRLPDTDDVMRLQQIRDWLGGQRFSDLSQHRLGAGPGLAMHWSRLPDLVPGAIIAALAPSIGRHAAEIAAVIVWPAMLLTTGLFLIARIARALGGPEIARTALIVAGIAYPSSTVFLPGRIDHHGFQVVLLLVMVHALIARGGMERGLIAGFAAAASIAIGLETLPLIAVAGAVIIAGWIGRGSDDALMGFGIALAAGLLTGITVLRTDQFLYPACDGFTAITWRMSQFAAFTPIVLAIAGYASKRREVRAGLAGLAGAVGVYGVWHAAPICLSPYGSVDPMLARLWLAHVGEAQSLFAAPTATAIGYTGLMVAGVAASLWRLYRTSNAAWATVLAFQLGALLLTLLQMRGAYTGAILAAPALAAVIAAARRRGTGSLAAAWIGSAGMLYPLAANAFTPVTGPSDAARHSNAIGSCTSAEALARFARLPRGRLLAPLDLGAYAIGASALQVVGAPYHRNNAGNAAVYRFFLGSPAKAQVIAKDWRVRYVAFCPDSFGELGAVDPLSLIGQLRAGHIPSWMRPMEGPDDGLTLFAIEPRLFERPATL
jgi:hypothetical protein